MKYTVEWMKPGLGDDAKPVLSLAIVEAADVQISGKHSTIATFFKEPPTPRHGGMLYFPDARTILHHFTNVVSVTADVPKED
jgi:hypothetical protein